MFLGRLDLGWALFLESPLGWWFPPEVIILFPLAIEFVQFVP